MKTRLQLFMANTYKPDAKVGRFLSVLVLFGIAYGLYRGIQDNYLAEIVHITPFERGIVEFFRETLGLFLIAILALMYKFSDSKIFKIGMALMAGGLSGYGGRYLNPSCCLCVVWFRSPHISRRNRIHCCLL
ncbi:hypothetical protein R83H12_01016 [Fibrobacteria bacterium R8-3-H12]